MKHSRVQRWLPLSGLLFVVAMVITFGMSGNSPDTDSPDAKIVAYLSSTSNYNSNTNAIFVLWLASLAFLVFWATLRTQLQAAEGRTGGLSALTFGAGVAATVFNLIGVTAFATPLFVAHDALHSHAKVNADVFRISQDFGYPVWILTSLIGALAVWGTAAVVWRTRMWPRWYAVVSIVVGLLGLASIVFYPVLLFGLWVALTAVMMIVKPGSPVADTRTTTSSVGAQDASALSPTT